jgi:hypothetical protein
MHPWSNVFIEIYYYCYIHNWILGLSLQLLCFQNKKKVLKCGCFLVVIVGWCRDFDLFWLVGKLDWSEETVMWWYKGTGCPRMVKHSNSCSYHSLDGMVGNKSTNQQHHFLGQPTTRLLCFRFEFFSMNEWCSIGMQNYPNNCLGR